MLNDSDRFRYLRHIMLDEVGEIGQERLFSSSVLIIGAGGLGSPNALYLAAAGIGRIGLVDFDKVDLSNLQRQILHNMENLGELKVESALSKLSKINDRTQFEPHCVKLDKNNILDLVGQYDFIIDATDNFESKFLINDACVLANKPLSHAGIYKFCGQTMSILPTKSACLACAFSPPPKEARGDFKVGLFGVIPGVLGSIQAAEAIKWILGVGEILSDKILSIDLKTMNFSTITIKRNPKCRICGENGIKELVDY